MEVEVLHFVTSLKLLKVKGNLSLLKCRGLCFGNRRIWIVWSPIVKFSMNMCSTGDSHEILDGHGFVTMLFMYVMRGKQCQVLYVVWRILLYYATLQIPAVGNKALWIFMYTNGSCVHFTCTVWEQKQRAARQCNIQASLLPPHMLSSLIKHFLKAEISKS